jgi:hypothetical protein
MVISLSKNCLRQLYLSFIISSMPIFTESWWSCFGAKLLVMGFICRQMEAKSQPSVLARNIGLLLGGILWMLRQPPRLGTLHRRRNPCADCGRNE